MKVRVEIEVADEVVNYHFKKSPKNSLRQFVYKFVHEAIELLEEEAKTEQEKQQ
tara:strand:+ start:395 stop:556 length:162 start_codon:yes stop_codon:yes gene_type:complete